jgi:hypothetical protein
MRGEWDVVKIKIVTAVAVFICAAAYALPVDLVVVSEKEARPDEAAGFYYLGPAGGGFLYGGSPDVLARVEPYRVLEGEAAGKEYYLVWVLGDGVPASAFERLGSAAAITDREILVGLDPAVDAEELRAVDRRIEFVKLEPVRPLDRCFGAEEPPAAKDPEIEAAVNGITADEYASYIQTLQDFGTRYTPTAGYTEACEYMRVFFGGLALDVTLFPFEYRGATYFNVIAERKGAVAPDEIVIICGHLDSTSQREYRETLAPGADDNASGVAVTMAAARALSEFEFCRTVRYCAFGGEEQGLYGSKAYALHCRDSGENLIAVMNADMVAYDEEGGGRDDFSVACQVYPWLLAYLEGVGDLYGNALLYDRCEFGGSDHFPFWLYGFSAMAAIEGEPGVGGITTYPYCHTIDDTLDKLQPDLAVRFARDYAAMFAHLASFDDTGIEEPRTNRAAPPRVRPVVKVYPNPYSCSTNAGGVRFEGLATPAAINVYDVAGRRVAAWTVAAGTDCCAWTPTKENGGALAPGIYLYRLEGQEQRKAGKIVIAK